MAILILDAARLEVNPGKVRATGTTDESKFPRCGAARLEITWNAKYSVCVGVDF